VLIELLSGFEEAHIYKSAINIRLSEDDVNFHFINDSLECEALVLSLTRRAILQLDELDQTERQISLMKLCSYWTETYNQQLKKAQKSSSSYYSFHPVLVRLLPHLILENTVNFSKEKCIEFINKKVGIAPHKVAEKIVCGILKPLGAIKLIQFLSPSSASKIHRVYHDVGYNLFDNDILILQMMLPLLDKKINVYQLIVEQYFSYNKEIREYLLEFKPLTNIVFQKFSPMIEDFFRFILHIMTDELCLVNNLYTRDPRTYIEQHDGNDRINKVIRKTLINILSAYSWIDLQELFEQVKHIININDLDECLG